MTSGTEAQPSVSTIRLSQDPAADALLARSPFALLVGMLLDQQFPMERAFAGPYVLSERIGHDIEPRELAAYDPEQLVALMSRPPAVHRFPGAMAKRIQQLATTIVDEYDGDSTRLWREVTTGEALLGRFTALPGFGKQKAKILVALLGKQFGVQPDGWREAAAPYGDADTRLSIADVTDADSLAEVRAAKRERKAAKRSGKASARSTRTSAS